MLSEFQLAMFEASGHMTPPQWSAVFAMAREGLRLREMEEQFRADTRNLEQLQEECDRLAAEVARLKGLQHENSVLMQSRRTLIRLNDQYREALTKITQVKGPTYGIAAWTMCEIATTALTPEASHD